MKNTIARIYIYNERDLQAHLLKKNKTKNL